MDENSSEIRRLNELFTSQWGKLIETLVDGDPIKQGLFVIRATGSSASIADRPDFRARAFGNRSPAAATRANAR